ncbi:hypothetical protein ACIPJG_33985 [Streptomyces halstedii]|uniref:hypothetical protein n=1 Tax=Streptomyces halstedii TaxID=1944 RepID=UPI00381D3B6B
MDHDIPTFPLDDPAETVMAALAHGMTGHPEKAAALFEPFINGGPATTVALCASLAEAAALGPCKNLPVNGAFGLLVVDLKTGQRGDINQAPAGVRFAAQFLTAWSNGQQDTAYALFRALVTADDDASAQALAEGIRALFEIAVVSLNEPTGRTS